MPSLRILKIGGRDALSNICVEVDSAMRSGLHASIPSRISRRGKGKRQRLSFRFDEPNVMRYVAGDSLDQRLQRQRPQLRVGRVWEEIAWFTRFIRPIRAAAGSKRGRKPAICHTARRIGTRCRERSGRGPLSRREGARSRVTRWDSRWNDVGLTGRADELGSGAPRWNDVESSAEIERSFVEGKRGHSTFREKQNVPFFWFGRVPGSLPAGRPW